MASTIFPEVRLAMKNTFLEFHTTTDDIVPGMRRNQSLPSMPNFEPSADCMPCKGDASSTPTTCLSVSDEDEIQSSLSSIAALDDSDTTPRGNDHEWSTSSVALNCSMQHHHQMSATRLATAPQADNIWQSCSSTSRSLQWSCTNSPVKDVDDSRTTLMFRNLPKDLDRLTFVQQLLKLGCGGLFDFVYMPMNLRESGNFGYVFVNFSSHTAATEVMARIERCDIPSCESWICMWSTCQGFSANVERYRNSPLMHPSVPAYAKPAMYDYTGAEALFPGPTKNIPKPRIHWSGPKKTSDAEEAPVTQAGPPCGLPHGGQARATTQAWNHGGASSKRRQRYNSKPQWS